MALKDAEMELNELKNENLELKFAAIRKDVSNLKIDIHRHLDMILEQVSIVNKSVSEALERIYALERQDNKNRIDKLSEELENTKEELKFWRTISNNKWIVGLIAFVLYALSIQELRDLLLTLLRIK